MSALCRSCGAAIVWAVTPAGKRTPLDAKPEKRTILMSPAGASAASTARCSAPFDCYTSHFATCPNAAQHRKPKEPHG